MRCLYRERWSDVDRRFGVAAVGLGCPHAEHGPERPGWGWTEYLEAINEQDQIHVIGVTDCFVFGNYAKLRQD